MQVKALQMKILLNKLHIITVCMYPNWHVFMSSAARFCLFFCATFHKLLRVTNINLQDKQKKTNHKKENGRFKLCTRIMSLLNRLSLVSMHWEVCAFACEHFPLLKCQRLPKKFDQNFLPKLSLTWALAFNRRILSWHTPNPRNYLQLIVAFRITTYVQNIPYQ